MRCVVTAGPAFEPIDQVRRLTNFSTGRLGTELACYLAQKGHAVTLLRSETATYVGETDKIERISFSTSEDLSLKIEGLRESAVEAFFHVAAVSDFSCGQVYRRDEDGVMAPLRDGKISSREQSVYLELVPAPKIIGRLRQLFPKAWLVGWKYEVEGGREPLLAKADAQIRANQTNACVVNGPAYGEGFGWVVPPEAPRRLGSNLELFDQLENSLPSTQHFRA